MSRTAENERRSRNYFPHIDGMRGIAVLAVVLYHMNPAWLPGGFCGVDVFFVISGFVVSTSFDEKAKSGFFHFAARFYARRIQRIFPALLVCLVVVGIVSTVFVPRAWLSDTNEQTALYAFFGLSNLILSRTGNDYFSPKTEFNAFAHTWSLGVEEQFYLVFPLLFYIWATAHKGATQRRISTLSFAGLFAASLAFACWASIGHRLIAFYTIFSRFWELAAGVLLYQATTRWRAAGELAARQRNSLGAIASLGLVAAGIAGSRPDAFPIPWAALPVVGCLGLLGFLRRDADGAIGRHLSNRYLVFVGRISYSLYLWHWPVIVMFRWTVGLDSFAKYSSAAALALLLSTMSFIWVERPIRYSNAIRRLPRIGVIGGGIATVALAFVFSQATFRLQPRLSLSVTRDAALWYPEKVDLTGFGGDCRVKTRSERLAGGSLDIYSRISCNAVSDGVRLFVIGDSHAEAYAGMLQRLAKETGVEVLLYNKGGCPIANLRSSVHDATPTCQAFAASVGNDVQSRARPGDILFLPSLRLARLGDQWALFQPAKDGLAFSDDIGEQDRLRFTEEAIALLQPMSNRGLRIILEAPKPIFAAPPFRCSDWFNSMNPNCASGFELQRKVLLEYRAPVMSSFGTVAERLPDVHVWDPFPVLCPEDVCRTSMAGNTLYFDGDHISGHANMVLYNSFAGFLRGLVGPQCTHAGDRTVADWERHSSLHCREPF